MANRRKKSVNRRGTRKQGSGGVPAWFWLLGGILIGLGAAVTLMVKGYLPELNQHLPALDSTSAKTSGSALLDESLDAAKPKKPRYDFFTVLPEMEVVVPEQELKRKAARKPEPTPATASSRSSNDQDNYVLQVGSFKSAADAEQMKARLAMMGTSANIQTVTVNGQTWNRVRIGPVKGARKADEMRRMLTDNRFEPLVMKVKP